MITIPTELKELALKEIIAKGLAVMIMIAWIAVLTYQNFNMSRKIDALQNQMYKLQSDVIKDNTKALYEFNLKTTTTYGKKEIY